MANTIVHKKNSTPGAAPSAGSLVAGELAVNTADGIVYLKKDDGAVVQASRVASVAGRTGDVVLSASDLADGTLIDQRLSTNAQNAINLYLWSSFR